MKSLTNLAMKAPIQLTLALFFGMAFLTPAQAQQMSNRIDPTYKFEFKMANKGDTAFTLYCVMKVSDISNFVNIYISYNDKSKQFNVKALLNDKSTEYYVEGYLIYFKINEQLDDPYVIIEGEDRAGKRHNIKLKDARNQVVDCHKGREDWHNSMARIDSMDFVRKFDGVYIGKDGKPRFTDQHHRVFVIEKDHIRPEKN
jgi:hypothetical protein